MMATRPLISGLGFALLLSALSLLTWSMLEDQQHRQVDARTDAVLELTHGLLRSTAQRFEDALDRLAARASTSPNEASWRRDASRYCKDFDGLVRLYWKRQDGEIWWEDSSETRADDLEVAEPTAPGDSVTGTSWRLSGESAIVTIELDSGVLAAELNVLRAFGPAVQQPASSVGYAVAVDPPSSEPRADSDNSWSRANSIEEPFHGTLVARPTARELDSTLSGLPLGILLALLSLSCLIGAGASLYGSLRRNSRDLRTANDQLHIFNTGLDEIVKDRTVQVERSRVAALNLAEDSKAIAQDLRNSEGRLRAVLESVADGIVILSPDHRIQSANSSALELLGVDLESMVDVPLDQVLPEIPASNTLSIKPNADRRLFDANITVHRPDETVPVNVVITEASGAFRTAVFHDLTRWIAAEERFRSVVESAPSAMVMIERSGEIVLVNSETERLFGYERHELVGRKIEMLVPTKYRTDHPERRERFFLSPHSRQMGEGRDLFAMRKDGTEFPVEIGINPIETESGIMALGVLVDITERKNAEVALRNYAHQLEEKNVDLDAFAHAVSHDLKAPLRGIISLAEFTLEDYAEALEGEGRENLEMVIQRCHRLDNLIHGILEYSRLGRSSSDPVRLDSQNAVEQVIDLLETPSGYEVTVEEALPPILYDEVQFAQVVQNLVSNALKYMGKPTGKVTIGADDTDGEWVFRVSDTGPGIDEKHFDKIFEVFRTLQSRDVIESTGVGLSLVKRIVERHGGRVWLESVQGEGSTFYFSVPKALGETIAPRAVASVEMASEALVAAGDSRVSASST